MFIVCFSFLIEFFVFVFIFVVRRRFMESFFVIFVRRVFILMLLVLQSFIMFLIFVRRILFGFFLWQSWKVVIECVRWGMCLRIRLGMIVLQLRFRVFFLSFLRYLIFLVGLVGKQFFFWFVGIKMMGFFVIRVLRLFLLMFKKRLVQLSVFLILDVLRELKLMGVLKLVFFSFFWILGIVFINLRFFFFVIMLMLIMFVFLWRQQRVFLMVFLMLSVGVLIILVRIFVGKFFFVGRLLMRVFQGFFRVFLIQFLFFVLFLMFLIFLSVLKEKRLFVGIFLLSLKFFLRVFRICGRFIVFFGFLKVGILSLFLMI